MNQKLFRFAFIFLATLPRHKATVSYNQPQFTIKAEENKAFHESCLIGKFKISSGKIADCLEHCLMNCSCQSFQICQKTECQLCASNKMDDNSLLRNKTGCTYAMYKNVQSTEEQCSTVSCWVRYNCCSQQPGLCPQNKICKPLYSLMQPWKRFICQCPDGYRGNNCDEPIRSCRAYLDGMQKSGTYKILGPSGIYEVFCHFDSYGAWTLVQSNSFENSTLDSFTKSLSQSYPLSQNTITWNGYRLNNARMYSIRKDSNYLRFTCDYEKHYDVKKSDYVEIPIETFGLDFDVLSKNGETTYISSHHGKVRDESLDQCRIKLHQENDQILHVHIENNVCNFVHAEISNSCQSKRFNFFGFLNPSSCLDKKHDCVRTQKSSAQLWFGHKN